MCGTTRECPDGVLGERTADLTHNLFEYHLSLVTELEGGIDSESMTT